MKPKVVIFDLDATLFDGGHRVHLIPEDPSKDYNWDAFNKECVNDKTIPWTMSIFFGLRDQLLEGTAPFTDIYFMTSRSNQCEEETLEALHKAGLGGFPLIMRERGDHNISVDTKSAMLDELEASGVEIVMAFDDEPEIVEMMNKRGIYAIKVPQWWDYGYKVSE